MPDVDDFYFENECDGYEKGKLQSKSQFNKHFKDVVITVKQEVAGVSNIGYSKNQIHFEGIGSKFVKRYLHIVPPWPGFSNSNVNAWFNIGEHYILCKESGFKLGTFIDQAKTTVNSKIRSNIKFLLVVTFQRKEKVYIPRIILKTAQR